MAKARDASTMDLFRDYEPRSVVERFEPQQVSAWNAAGRLSKAVAATLADAKMSRQEIGEAMSHLLQDNVSKAMLDAYASQAKEDHTISAIRLFALMKVTGDCRAINAMLADLDLIAIPAKYEPLLRRERAREMRARLEREEQAADAEWRARR